MEYQCDALIRVSRVLGDRFAPCPQQGTDLHHKLPRARGGKLLDKAGEEYHLIRLCREHHSWAHQNPVQAMAGGLTIDGYVEKLNGRICYHGTDEVLRAKYPAPQ